MGEIADRHGARSFGEARFLSRVERALGDAFEPLGLRVDRWIGVRVGEDRLQPTFAVMPPAPSDFDASWHEDFLGVVDIAQDVDLVSMIRTLRGAPACGFAVAVSGSGLDVAVARAADGWNIVRPLPDDVIRLIGASVAASAFRR